MNISFPLVSMMKPRPDSAGFHQIPDSGTAAFAVNAMMHPQAAAIFPNIDIHDLVMSNFLQ
jgi:hypothetical protein